MDYILLILVVILFINKQYNDISNKNTYNETFGNKNNKKKSSYKHTKKNYNDILGLKNKSYKKNKPKQLLDILFEIREKNDDYYELYDISEELNNNSDKNIKIKQSIKDYRHKANSKMDISKSFNNKLNDFNNNNNRYNMIDIKEGNTEINKEHEAYKETVIQNINKKIIDKGNEEITYKDSRELINREITYKDNEKVISEEVTYKDDEELINEEIVYKDNKELINGEITYKDNEEVVSEELTHKNGEELINEEITYNNKQTITKESILKEKHGFNELKNKYKGINVSVLISELGILEGEIVFDFPNVIALKNKENIIIFIDESKVLSIY